MSRTSLARLSYMKSSSKRDTPLHVNEMLHNDDKARLTSS